MQRSLAWWAKRRRRGGGEEDERVVELRSETLEDVEGNGERVLAWIQRWVEDRKKDTAKQDG